MTFAPISGFKSSRLVSINLLTTIIIAVVVSCLFIGCVPNEKNQTATFHAMGGIPVHVIASNVSTDWLNDAVARTQKQVMKWEAELSLYQPNSAVNQVRFAKNDPVLFSEHGWKALSLAKELQKITDGSFDVTVGPIVKVWKNAEKLDSLPTQQDILAALEVTGFEHLEMMPEIQGIMLSQNQPNNPPGNHPEIRLDVGGFAKGLFAQWINESLRDYANESNQEPDKIIIDLGGDMFVSSRLEQTRCTVGIRDPFSSDPQKLWGIITLNNGAVVTSGTYERHFMINGRRYCHIVDPKTGAPVETEMVSVTVVDPSGGIADALATAIFVMGEEKGRQLISSRGNTEIVIIRQDRSYFVSDGLKETLKIL